MYNSAFPEICFAGIRKDNENQFYISDLNEKFDRLITNKSISLEFITKSIPFRKAIEEMTPFTDNVLYISENIMHRYSLTAIPVIEKGKLIKMLIFLNESVNEENNNVLDELTQREKEVLVLAAEGCTNRNIADRLDIKEGTVKKILYNCYHKLDITSRVDAVKMIYKKRNSE